MTKRVTNVGSHDGMVDITDLKSVAVRRPGSSPGGSTTLKSLHKMYTNIFTNQRQCIPKDLPASVLKGPGRLLH